MNALEFNTVLKSLWGGEDFLPNEMKPYLTIHLPHYSGSKTKKEEAKIWQVWQWFSDHQQAKLQNIQPDQHQWQVQQWFPDHPQTELSENTSKVKGHQQEN